MQYGHRTGDLTMRRRTQLRGVPAAVLLVALVQVTLFATSAAASGPYLVKLTGAQWNPAATAAYVICQSAGSTDGDSDLIRVAASGALPAEVVAGGAGLQQSPTADGRVVAFVDRSNPSSGDPADTVWSIKVRDITAGTVKTIVTGKTPVSSPSIKGNRLVWTRGSSGERDVMVCDLDGDLNGTPDFAQNPGWVPSVSTVCDGASDQYSAVAGDRGVVWVEHAGGVSDPTRVVFRQWTPGAVDVELSGSAGYKQPTPHTAGAKVVWQQKDGSSSVIASHDVDTKITSKLASVQGAVNEKPVTDGARVAWQSRVGTGKSQVWVRDSSGKTGAVAPYASNQTSPALLPSGLLWIDDRNDAGDIALLSSKALISVSLSLSAPEKPAYASAKLTGTLKSGGGAVLSRKVAIERSYDNKTWSYLGSATTGFGGTYAYSVKPTKKTFYRAYFKGDSTYGPSGKITRSVLPKVSLSTPKFSRKVLKYRRSYTASGLLRPRHSAGTKPVVVKAYLQQKRSNGTLYYAHKKSYKAKAYNYTSSNGTKYTKYKVAIKLPSKGKWRLRAYHAADSLNSATYSSYGYVTVR